MATSPRSNGLVDPERLRQALALLREAGDRGLTKTQFARKLGGMSTRSVDRAVQLLIQQGARIDKGRSGRPAVIHFRLLRGPNWDENVSGQARLALRLAALSLGQSGTLLWQEKLETLEQLASAHMTARDRALFETLQQAVAVRGGVEDPVESPEILEPLLRALEAGKALEVEYQSARASEPSLRVVVPHSLTHDLYSGSAFLLAWDMKRAKPIHLRLGRLGRARVISLPAGFKPQAATQALQQAAHYQVGGWFGEGEPFQVRVRISGPHWIQALREAPPALPGFETRPIEGSEAVEARFHCTHSAGASRWVLQMGEAAEVLEPQWLRAEIRERLESALKQYR